MLTRIVVYLVLAAIGVGIYYGIDYLQESWREWLAGKKTKVLAWSVIILPEAVDILTQVQALGIFDYAPGQYQKFFTQGIGILVLVCRLRTTKEQGG